MIRVLLTDDARPGQTFRIAIFGANGPISASPRNYIWLRGATLDFFRPESAQSVEAATYDVVRAAARFAIAAYLNVPVYAAFHEYARGAQDYAP